MYTSQRSTSDIVQSVWQATQFGSGSCNRTLRSSESSQSSISHRVGNRGSDQERFTYDGDGDFSDVREVCMTVCIALGRIGAAYYDPQYGDVYVFEDIVESYITCDVLKALIAHVQPTCVIASGKQDEKVMFHLKSMCLAPASAAASEDEPAPVMDTNMDKPKLILLRAWDFGYTSCKRRICTVVGNSTESGMEPGRRFGRAQNDDGDDAFNTEMRVKTAFVINFDASCMVRALGALLKYLNLKRLGKTNFSVNSSMNTTLNSTSENAQHLRDETIKADGIYSIKKFTLEKTLLIDVSTFEGLQIFQQQYHPSVYKAGRAGLKEGLSLFNICDYCRSGPGSLELRRWFLRPSTDIVVLQKRLDAVEYLVDDNNDEIVEAMSKTLQRIRHVTAILNRMRSQRTSVRDWSSLYKTLSSCFRLGELVRMRQKLPDLLTELAEALGPPIQNICSLLAQIMDFDESRKENRLVVKAGVDEELDARKEFYARLPEVLAAVAREEMMLLDVDLVDDCRLIYMPLLGYLMTLPHRTDTDSDTGTFLRDDGLELVFVADDIAHYKSAACRKLDDEFGDIKFKIIDRETSIMLNMQNVFIDQAELILDAVRSAAHLDCLISLAMAAKTFGWRKPTIIESNIINIEGGKHPLQEILDENSQFVPNPVRSGGFNEQAAQEQQRRASSQAPMTTIRQAQTVLTPYPKVHLLTGPNASGKSVYLKQVGLLAYMAHVGCFVPAVKAEIGVLDGIYSRLRTLDSVTGGMSSFAIDLRQMSGGLKQATGRSLILIDEFGKGTATETGCSLLAASLEYWLGKASDECPHVFVCSHLYRIMGLLPQSPLLEFLTLTIEEKDDELVFMYKLVDGTVDSSLALYTAQAAGLPISTLQRAVQVFDNIKSAQRIRRRDMTEEAYRKEYQRMAFIVDKFLFKLDFENRTLPFKRILSEIVSSSYSGNGGSTSS